MKILLLFLVLSSVSAHAWSLLQPANETCAKKWEQIEPMKRGELESKLLSFGLSSTGVIKIHNIYSLTDNSSLGQQGDRMAMVVQEDLTGSRLFWVILINLETKTTQVIYSAKKQEAEQAAP